MTSDILTRTQPPIQCVRTSFLNSGQRCSLLDMTEYMHSSISGQEKVGFYGHILSCSCVQLALRKPSSNVYIVSSRFFNSSVMTCIASYSGKTIISNLSNQCQMQIYQEKLARVHCIVWHIVLYHIVSYPVASYRIVSYRIVSYRIASYHIV